MASGQQEAHKDIGASIGEAILPLDLDKLQKYLSPYLPSLEGQSCGYYLGLGKKHVALVQMLEMS